MSGISAMNSNRRTPCSSRFGKYSFTVSKQLPEDPTPHGTTGQLRFNMPVLLPANSKNTQPLRLEAVFFKYLRSSSLKSRATSNIKTVHGSAFLCCRHTSARIAPLLSNLVSHKKNQ